MGRCGQWHLIELSRSQPKARSAENGTALCALRGICRRCSPTLTPLSPNYRVRSPFGGVENLHQH